MSRLHIEPDPPPMTSVGAPLERRFRYCWVLVVLQTRVYFGSILGTTIESGIVCSSSAMVRSSELLMFVVLPVARKTNSQRGDKFGIRQIGAKLDGARLTWRRSKCRDSQIKFQLCEPLKWKPTVIVYASFCVNERCSLETSVSLTRSRLRATTNLNYITRKTSWQAWDEQRIGRRVHKF